MSEEQKYIDFEAYERVAEPHKRERVSACQSPSSPATLLRISVFLEGDAVVEGLGAFISIQ